MGTQRSQLSEQCWLKSEARERVWRHAELTAERVVDRRDQEDHHRDEHFWGVPQAHIMFVQRKGTTVEKFDSVTNDGQWVRAISRVGWDTLNPPGIVRIWDATP
jgi:hypothetical protein